MQVRRFVSLVAVLASVTEVPTTFASPVHRPQERPFALVVDSKVISVNGAGTSGRNQVETYASTHGGSYLVFEDHGVLYVDGNLAEIKEAQRRYMPLLGLNAQQTSLSDKQKPREQQLKELSEKMKAAMSPEEQNRLGEEMSRIGQEMSTIGEQQSSVGEQQGRVARAFYDWVQTVLSRCLGNKSCLRA